MARQCAAERTYERRALLDRAIAPLLLTRMRAAQECFARVGVERWKRVEQLASGGIVGDKGHERSSALSSREASAELRQSPGRAVRHATCVR